MTLRDLRRFAPFGLYLAGLAAIVTIALFIVYRTFNLPIQISLGVTVVGLAMYVLLDPQGTREALTGRQARYGSNALLMTLAFVGIVIVINYLVFNNTKQWDLTEDKQNTLSPETIKTLDSLKSPVKAVGYFTAANPADTARTLLTNYKNSGKGKFDFQFVDPNANPIQAQQDNITTDGTIVLKMDGRQEQVSYASEEELTGALVRLANPGKRAVYFLTGHGEFPLDTSSQNNYSEIKTSLTAKNYTVNTLNLLSTPKIPDDALAIIVGGPKTAPLSQEEVDLLKAYQAKGGSLVYMAEPNLATKFADKPDPMVAYLQQEWGIKLDNDMVVDPSSNQPVIAITQTFGSHPITSKMPPSQVVIMPTARSVEAGQAPAGVTLTALAGTSNQAWGETDPQEIESGQVKPDQGKDLMGPVNLAVAGTNDTTHARILVIGDSDFASSQVYASYGNSYFIINGIDWAAAQDNLISLTPHQPTQRFLALPQVATFGLILLGSVFLMPALVVLTGVTVWIQRRRKG
jgi:ABC-type uncharacterized transport system involved in gliding motility auxiliary subunit